MNFIDPLNTIQVLFPSVTAYVLTGIFPGAGIGPTSSEQSSPENIYAYTYILEQIERKSIIAYYKECILMQKKN